MINCKLFHSHSLDGEFFHCLRLYRNSLPNMNSQCSQPIERSGTTSNSNILWHLIKRILRISFSQSLCYYFPCSLREIVLSL